MVVIIEFSTGKKIELTKTEIAEFMEYASSAIVQGVAYIPYNRLVDDPVVPHAEYPITMPHWVSIKTTQNDAPKETEK